MDQQGTVRIECDGTEDYTTVNTVRGSILISKLTFNPKKDTYDCDKLVVQFCDAQGNWYKPIDTGIIFAVPFSMEDFAFPLLGSSALDDVYQFNVENTLMGNPIGDLAIEKPHSTAFRKHTLRPTFSRKQDRICTRRTQAFLISGARSSVFSTRATTAPKRRTIKKDSDSDKPSDKDIDKSSDSGSQLPYDPDDMSIYYLSLLELLEEADKNYNEDEDMFDAPISSYS